jgi:hypothetical protein
MRSLRIGGGIAATGLAAMLLAGCGGYSDFQTSSGTITNVDYLYDDPGESTRVFTLKEEDVFRLYRCDKDELDECAQFREGDHVTLVFARKEKSLFDIEQDNYILELTFNPSLPPS